MRKIFTVSIISLFFIGMNSLESQAKSYYLKFNEKQSKINFFVSTSLHDANGEVKKFKGFIDIKGEGTTVEKASGLLEITANSLFTNQSQRDSRLKSTVLSVLDFPLIKFKVTDAKITSNKMDKDGTLYLRLIGPLTIRDVSKNVEIPVKVKMSADKKSASVEGNYTVNFKEYNVPDPSIPIVGKVDENINISFNIKAN